MRAMAVGVSEGYMLFVRDEILEPFVINCASENLFLPRQLISFWLNAGAVTLVLTSICDLNGVEVL